ncbi:MAG: hypothetical protein V4547_10195 [Bacteroidota bacterium]
MDDDDFSFGFDDLSSEEMEELAKEQREKNEQIRTSPIFKKASDIIDTVTALVESLSEKDREFYESSMIESAMMLSPKIAGAMGSKSWLLSMQNAAIIRYHAAYLHTSTSGLKMFTNAQTEYVQLLRTEMEEFRELFKKWVKSFDQLENEEYTDDWGLFIRNS